MNGEWVVAYRIEVSPWQILIEEFYRGDFEDCMRIKYNSFAGGEHDMHWSPHPWLPLVKPADEWDALVEGN